MRSRGGRASHAVDIGDCVARWSELVLLGPDGKPDATISATSYVRGSDTARPVAFLWNGGPGASSSPLHLNALGPRILRSGEAVENAVSLLDAADLVFVDPVGTGFSRVLRDAANARLLTVPGDADAVETFIRAWLRANDREHDSIHLIGESFGGYRLAAVAPQLTDLRLESITLISPMLDATTTAEAPENDLALVFSLPTMAVAAWFHGAAGTGVDDVAEVWAVAERFAVEQLLPALHRGAALDPVERVRLAARMAEMLGLSPDAVLAADLRVGSEDFLRSLRAAEGLVVGRLDVRVTGALPEPHPEGRPPAADDPALGLGRGNIIHSAAIARYLRDEVGAPVGADEPYVSLSLDLNFAWDWRPAQPMPPVFRTSVVSNLGEVATAHPGLRILVLGGYFDLATTLSSTIHAVQHSGAPASAIDIHPLTAGHSLDETVLVEARDAISRTITHTSKAGTRR
ncbi:MAG: peptidase [Microbacterium sp.]|nr:peptidase [Microbacterium sp.]